MKKPGIKIIGTVEDVDIGQKGSGSPHELILTIRLKSRVTNAFINATYATMKDGLVQIEVSKCPK